MKTKSITTIMITLFLASLLTITLGVAPVTAKTNRYVQDNWVSPSFFMLGPVASAYLEGYYGEPVYIEFSVTNSWTIHETPQGDVQLSSNLKGIAEIYSETHSLIETRDFVCHEKGIDRGGDNGAWTLDDTWYDMFIMSGDPLPTWFVNLEHWTLEWKIQGLFLYKVTIIDGQCIQCEHGVSHEWVHP